MTSPSQNTECSWARKRGYDRHLIVGWDTTPWSPSNSLVVDWLGSVVDSVMYREHENLK